MTECERGTDRLGRRAKRFLSPSQKYEIWLQQVSLAGEAGTIVQTTPLRPTQRANYQALSIDPSPRISVFDPA